MYRWKRGVPGYARYKVTENMKQEGTHNVGMENNLLH